MFVWLITITHQDEVNRELAVIDKAILCVKSHLDNLKCPSYYIIGAHHRCYPLKPDNIGLRFGIFVQTVCDIESDQSLKINLNFLWIDDKEYNINEFVQKCIDLGRDKKEFITACDSGEIEKMLNWNEHRLEQALKHLLNYLFDCKNYISCGNVPVH